MSREPEPAFHYRVKCRLLSVYSGTDIVACWPVDMLLVDIGKDLESQDMEGKKVADGNS